MASHQLSGDNAVDTTALFLERKEVFASSFTKNKYFDFINSSSMHFYFYFCFFFLFLNKAKLTLTFNNHGLTLHPTTVDVSKLKTFQLAQKILKP